MYIEQMANVIRGVSTIPFVGEYIRGWVTDGRGRHYFI